MDMDDRNRTWMALIEAHRVLGRAVHAVPRAYWGRDDRFIYWVSGRSPHAMSERQRDHLHRVAWRLRRFLPAHLAPKCDPDDPLVRDERHAAWNWATYNEAGGANHV